MVRIYSNIRSPSRSYQEQMRKLDEYATLAGRHIEPQKPVPKRDWISYGAILGTMVFLALKGCPMAYEGLKEGILNSDEIKKETPTPNPKQTPGHKKKGLERYIA